ncbi:MAG TPA: hypothetical protein VGX03_15050 [Candidatus Binatia bacterium]|jgi:hypothetical protein|nr:hypothetical protein [Candidatus Binatia bacterium]
MAGKQHTEPDDAGRWQPAPGMAWPHRALIKEARRQYQQRALPRDRSLVREYPKRDRASEQEGV